MFRINDILQPSRIFMDLKGADKSEILKDMTDRLVAQNLLTDSEQIHRLLIERERMMTTGVKSGFAFPHVFSEQFDQTFLTLGIVRDGVDYEALDRQVVEFVFLLLGPPGHQTVHLRILARLSRITGQGGTLVRMRSASRPEQILECLAETEQNIQTPHGQAIESV